MDITYGTQAHWNFFLAQLMFQYKHLKKWLQPPALKELLLIIADSYNLKARIQITSPLLMPWRTFTNHQFPVISSRKTVSMV